ncbi:PREDICTED: free fatty acid receptor 2-like [Gekko japonicus]|uniref:Free fatty acid receptor 2-like n=1 Tax=Gekko japonicus TaxID=146911 RepID=A0ABM1JNX9_GEKJA|nr:PREDICTED: free fatty acid receptor 2-like [Gekko japonicus]
MMVLEAVDLVACLFILLTGLPSNLLAFYTLLLNMSKIMKVRKKPAPIDILLFNLTVSDILLLLFLPFKMIEVTSYMIWPLSPLLCPLTSYFLYGSVYTSILFLTAVGVDRYLAVGHPIRYKLNRRPAYAIMASIFIWLLVISHYGIIYVAKHQDPKGSHPNSSNASHCYENFSPDVILPVRLEICLVFFCLPFIITLFCYVKVIQILNSLPNFPACKKQRAVGLAVATLVSFVICFGPFNVSHIVGFIQNKGPPWRMEGFLFSAFNASIDPVIFYFSSKAIRQTFTDCWNRMRLRLQTLVPWCRWTCCQSPTNNDEGEGAGEYSSSYLQGKYQVNVAQTECQKTRTAAPRNIKTLQDDSQKEVE